MYPMKLSPVFKDYLWGGNELKRLYGKECDYDSLAESWELCCHPDGESIVKNGAHKGMKLSEILEKRPEFVSKRFKSGDKFPILIKFIDAKKDLSIQVHPSDDTARRDLREEGKAEMWYVISARPRSFLYYGLNREISKEELEIKLRDGSITEVLNKVSVRTGDVFFINPGTIHAICAGTVIAEIQQNSNTTFRIYDYGRKDKNGKTRDLHIDRAVDVIDMKPVIPSQIIDNNEILLNNGMIRKLFECKYFNVMRIQIYHGKMKFMCDELSFHSLLIVRGSGHIEIKGKRYDYRAGDSIFMPAGMGEYYLVGDSEVLLSKL